MIYQKIYMLGSRLIITVLLLLMFYACSLRPQTHTSESANSQWRGEKRDGIYNETGLLKEWPVDGPQLLWKYEGLGEGHTSAAIANGRLFITGLINDMLTLFAFDLNGQLLHKKEICPDWNENNSGPRSTICINDGKLYIYSAYGKLVCLDTITLDEVWSKDLFSDFDGQGITWGVTESPLIVDEKIIMTPGGVSHNIVALNKNTGDLIWTTPGESTVSAYCSPQYIDDREIAIVVTSVFDYIIAINMDTGEKLWSFPRTSEFNNHPNTPLYHNGMIFSPTGDRGGSVMLRLKNGGKEVEQVWENLNLDTQMGGAVRIGDYVYASGHRDRNWFCVDWNTGETKYKVRDIAPCSVISADGMLYCYSEKGTMNLVRPNPEKFELISSFSVTFGSGTHWAHPVIHKGVLYLRHGDTLMAYQIK
ncbi:MAG: PQQ-binding-like beta-propeller repeat protein [Tannerella sp.]|jgi:outer membrane protein assembly factor BamB|nr:PQQ-binding-like beta-propeller repeat protein [Tannerella sp.]